MESENSYKDNFNEVNEGTSKYIGFVQIRRRKIKREYFSPPIEKLQLFTQMLRREALYKTAKIIRK